MKKEEKKLDEFEQETETVDNYGPIIGGLFALSILLIGFSIFLLLTKDSPRTEMRWPTFTVVTKEENNQDVIIEPNSELQDAYKNGTQEEIDQALFHQYQSINEECIGVIRIEGTVLNHPLMQSPQNEAFYLSHDIYKEKNGHGIPFLIRNGDLSVPGKNNIIYGHNMRWEEKDVFYALAGYESLDYYKEHPYIDIITEGETGKYIIFAYFIADNADSDAFYYWLTTEWKSDTAFNNYMAEVYKRNWLFTDLPICKEDYFILLSSCSMELSGLGTNRMVVMARKVRENEDIQKYLDTTTIKPAPYLPEKLR